MAILKYDAAQRADTPKNGAARAAALKAHEMPEAYLGVFVIAGWFIVGIENQA